MEKKFIENLKEALEIEDYELAPADKFRDYPEWDSLNRLSLIAMLDDEYGLQIENKEFEELITVADIINKVKTSS